MEYTYPFTDRGTGRTTFMLGELVHSVCEGQPYSIVVGASYPHCKELFKSTHEMLMRYFPTEITVNYSLLKIYAGESEILFFTKAEFEGDRVRGMSLNKYGIFEDHLAAGEE